MEQKPAPTNLPDFTRWINLAQPRLGAKTVFATDDFFAPKERMISPKEPIFIADKYDENGKWMDGWESRRKRGGGYDYCIVKLGSEGIVKGVDINTSFFTGNFPPEASLEACVSYQDIPDDTTSWHMLIDRRTLNGDNHNFVAVANDTAWTHLRLNIFPDGGVARLRVYGIINRDWTKWNRTNRFDLAAMEFGGRPIACNNEHYGTPGNMIAPGKGINMGDGWETRRRREPGHDWAVLALAHPGVIDEIIVDTAYFKGNYPDRCYIQAANVPVGTSDEAIAKQAESWPVLLPESKLEMDREHAFKKELADLGTVSHVRLNIIPDGGVSRLRLMGKIT